MSDTSVTRILILAEVEIGRRWEEILRGPATLVWLGRAAIPPGEHPEIILADACVPQAASGRAAVRDEVGVVLVGGDGPADVYLGADCSAEELCGACRLLGEIVRLRRRAVQAAQTNRELTEAAMTDPLTGLANRRAWDLELARRIKGDSPHLCAAPSGPFRQMGTVPFYSPTGRRLCLAVLDLDQFKEINDGLGHAAGDRLLQAVSRAMQENLRQGDFIARLGGDEFGLLLWAPGEAEAAAIVDRVRRHVALAAGAAGFAQLTASAGFALSGTSATSDSPESLFLAADAALIAAKREGRNRLRFLLP